MKFCFTVIITFLFCFTIIKGQEDKVKKDSLINIIKTTKNDTLKVNALITLSSETYNTDSITSLKYINTAISISQKAGYNRGILKSFRIKAGFYSGKNYIKAIEYLKKALYVAKKIHDINEVAYLLGDIGKCYREISDYPEALKYYFESLKIFREANNKYGIAGISNAIGVTYSNLGNHTQSLNFYLQSLNIYKNIGDSIGIARLYNNIGGVYLNENKFSEALDYYFKALEIKKYNKDTNMIIYLNNNIGMVYLTQKKYSEALDYFNKSLELNKNNIDYSTAAHALANIGTVYKELKNYNTALSYLKKSLNMYIFINDKVNVNGNYREISEVYENLSDYKNAYINFKLHKIYYDSIFNEENNNKLTNLQAKYTIEKNEELRKKEFELLKSKNKIKTIENQALIAISFFILFIGFSFYRQQRLKIKKNQAELEASKIKELHLKNDIKYKNNELINLATHIIEKNKFLNVLIRDIKKINFTHNDKKISDNNNEIIKLINKNLVTEKDQDEFEKHIEQISQNFYKNLDKKYPDLTNNEKRLCTLIRLGISSKEISLILNIEPRSVIVNRYRLRKKFHLESDENLQEFLNDINEEIDNT